MSELNSVIFKSITEKNGVPFVTSLQVAEFFGKEHRNVIRDIKDGDWSEGFGLLNFEQSSYLNKQNKKQPCYEITKDGFIMLTMGYSGKKAAKIKEAYINGFNKMQASILSKGTSSDSWLSIRQDGKVIRRDLTDIIQNRLIPMAIEQGSRNSGRLYQVYTKMVKDLLFEFREKVGRDHYNFRQLAALQVAEDVVGKVINDLCNERRYYKDIYKAAKLKIQNYADIVGKTPVVPERKTHLRLLKRA